jgi:hypothetical protein
VVIRRADYPRDERRCSGVVMNSVADQGGEVINKA